MKKRKILSLILSLVMILTAFPLTAVSSFAEDDTIHTSGDFEYEILDDGTAEITKYAGNATELEIPSELDGYTVTSIGDEAFCDCTSLENIILPNSLSYIGADAFYNTAYYKNPDNWNDGVLYIGNFLIAIEQSGYFDEELGGPGIASSVPKVYKIKDGTVGICDGAFSCAFRKCPELETLIIPDSVIYIGYHAFRDCEALTSVVFGSNIEIIEKEAFFDCLSLTSVTIPESVICIEDEAFGYYNNEDWITVKIDGFTIYGYEGSEAERYANDNGFTFIALEKEPIVEPTPDDPTPNPNPDDPTPNPNPDDPTPNPNPDDPTPTPEAPADLNGDGKTTVVDAKWTLQAVAGSRTLTAEQRAIADVNGDGKVTVVDAKWILQAVAGMRVL